MWTDVRFRARALFRSRSLDRELEQELRAHLDAQTQKYCEAGLPPAEAARRARLDFGGVDAAVEACRDARGVRPFEVLAADLRYALRALRKDRLLAAVAILTLALGIGAATTVFSVVETLLLKPLPYPAADRIAFPWRIAPPGINVGFAEIPWGRTDFLTLRRESRTFASLGAFLGASFNLTGAGEPARLDGARVSAGFFPSLGTPAALGRVFTADEDRPGHDREAVLSDEVWQRRFGADPSIVGRPIDLDGQPYVVVGVMPPGFTFPRASELPGSFSFPAHTQVWVPLALPTGPAWRGEPSELAVVGRLKRGVMLEQAQAELDLFGREMERRIPAAKGWFHSRLVPATTQIVGDSRRPLLLVFAAVGIVLLIVCANVAGLLLTRSIGRMREFTLRTALGATRARLIAQLLCESLLLGVLGGGGGVLLAAGGVEFVKRWGPAGTPRLGEIHLDAMALGFALAVSLLTGLCFGTAPALLAARAASPGSLLRGGGGRSVGHARDSRLRHGLLVVEVALALVLVVASGLLVRTFVRVMQVDGGFDADHVLTFELTLPTARYPDTARIVQFYDRTLRRLSALHGVRAAGLGETLPMGGPGESTGLRVPGRPPNHPAFAAYTIASPGYFAAVGTRVMEGRAFTGADNTAGAPVAIVSQAMANAYWPGQDAIGRQVGLPILPYNMTVVGVVADVKHASLRESSGPEIYVPFTQKVWPSMQTMRLAVRSSADPSATAAAVREAVRAEDPDLPLARVQTLQAIVDGAVARQRFTMLLLVGFGVVALVLACVGLYGAASYTVTQRTQEIGVRVALGASRARVVELMLGRGLRLTLAGVAIGLVAALGVTRTMRGFLFGVTPTDVPTFAAVSALLVAVGTLACYLPARRAASVDPVVALRHD
ncbi:MAG TPA: ABC transporter permease [Vicinamibacterales bacterium]|nr:ABC transporter permease [Vicinamibacterales bacterium]